MRNLFIPARCGLRPAGEGYSNCQQRLTLRINPCSHLNKLLPSPTDNPIRDDGDDNPKERLPRHPAQPTSRTPSQTPPRASAPVGVFGFLHASPRITLCSPRKTSSASSSSPFGAEFFSCSSSFGGQCTNAANPAKHDAITSLRRLLF